MEFAALALLQAQRSDVFSPVSRSCSLEVDRPEKPHDIAANPLHSAMFSYTNRVRNDVLAPSNVVVIPATALEENSWELFAAQDAFLFFLVVEKDQESFTTIFLGSEGDIPDEWSVLGAPGDTMTFLKDADYYQVASSTLLRLHPAIARVLDPGVCQYE